MTDNMDIDFSKMPITSHGPLMVAKVGLNALGCKATVVPGFIPRIWPVKLFGFLIDRARTGLQK